MDNVIEYVREKLYENSVSSKDKDNKLVVNLDSGEIINSNDNDLEPNGKVIETGRVKIF